MGSYIWPPSGGGGVTSLDGLTGDLTLVAGTGISIVNGTNTITLSLSGSSFTAGNLTDAGTDGITVGNGTGAVNGSGTTISQHVADTTHNGYLSSTDWNTFNNKQSALTFGNLTDAGTDGITIGNGTGSVIGSGTTISQHVADTTHNGYLSSTDWNTFNSKQATVTIGSLDAQAANANGLALVSNVLSTQSADATHPGMVNNTTQTFSGFKTITSSTASNVTPQLRLTNTGTPSVLGGAVLQLATDSGAATTNNKGIGVVQFAGATDASDTIKVGAYILGESTESWSGTATGAKLNFLVTGNTTTTQNTALLLDQDLQAYFHNTVNVTSGSVNITSLTASQAVVTDSSKNLVSLAYTDANTASTLVSRDGSGNFSAVTITASLSGNATSATTATTATNATNTAITDDTTTNATMFPTWVTTASGNQAQKVSSTKLTFNPSTGTLTTTTFSGALSGNATTATTATNATNVATTATNSTNASFFPLFVASSSSGNQGCDTATGLSFNPSTNTLTTNTFSGALSGNATTATTATNATNVATTATNSTNASFFPTFVAAGTSGNQGIDTATGLTFNPSTNTLTTTTFVGALTGTASGNTTYTANNHGVVVSSSTNAMTVVAPVAATTKVLTSAGTGSDPIFDYPAFNYTAQTTTYSAVINDYVDCTSGTFTVTLPTAASVTGKSIIVGNSGTGVITIATTSSQTIMVNGTAIATGVIKLGSQGDVFRVTSDGSNWKTTVWKIWVGAFATFTSAQNSGNGSDAQVSWGNVITNPQSDFSSNQYTVSIPGNYTISSRVRFNSVTGTDPLILSVYKNGSLAYRLEETYGIANSQSPSLAGTITLTGLVSGDTIRIYSQDNARAVALETTAGYNYFSIVRTN